MESLTFYAKHTIQSFFMNCWERDVSYQDFKISNNILQPSNEDQVYDIICLFRPAATPQWQ
jgi:hypothetical protein